MALSFIVLSWWWRLRYRCCRWWWLFNLSGNVRWVCYFIVWYCTEPFCHILQDLKRTPVSRTVVPRRRDSPWASLCSDTQCWWWWWAANDFLESKPTRNELDWNGGLGRNWQSSFPSLTSICLSVSLFFSLPFLPLSIPPQNLCSLSSLIPVSVHIWFVCHSLPPSLSLSSVKTTLSLNFLLSFF